MKRLLSALLLFALTVPLSAQIPVTGIKNGTNNYFIKSGASYPGWFNLFGTANIFTAAQTINVNSATALLVEQDGVKDNTLIVDTTNGRVGVGGAPGAQFHIHNVGGLGEIRLSGTAANSDSFDVREGITGISNSGFSIYDVEATATRLAIDTNGLVGINETAPSAQFEVESGNAARIPLIVRGAATDTANLITAEANDGTDKFTIGDDGEIYSASAGPHTIGGAAADYRQFLIQGVFTSGGGSVFADGFSVTSTLVGAAGDTSHLAGVKLDADIQTQAAAEVVSKVAQVWIEEPNINLGAGSSVTDAVTLYIAAAPTEGGTGNYALWVDSGATKLDGTLTVEGAVTVPAIKITTGASAGYYLQSDADGDATWTAVSAAQVYKGTWAASTNTPTLADGGGTAGWYYRAIDSGTVDFGAGNITFAAGDDVTYSGSVWQKVPGQGYTLQTATDSVLGGIKVGGSLQINSSVLNVNNADMGDITTSGTGADTGKVWTIDAGVVTYAKIQDVSATDKLLGRSTAGAGDVEEIACTSFARSILDDANEATFKGTVNLEAGVDVEAYDATIIKQADVDDTPVNAATTVPVSSNWAYDHAASQSVHGIAVTALKTFTVTNSLTLSGNDAASLAIGAGGTLGTAAYTAATAYATASHNNTAHSETYITSAGVTYTNLNANGSVGTGATQVAVGNHAHTGTYIPLAGSDSITGNLTPNTDNSIDLGTATFAWKDGHFEGVVYTDGLNTTGAAQIAVNADLNSGYDILAAKLWSNSISSTPSAGGVLNIGGQPVPTADNSYTLGTASYRWSDVRSVKINGADVGFANGWKLREYPLAAEDVGKSYEWMREHANQGIQLLDEQDRPIVVFHRNGDVYMTGKILPMSALPKR